MKMRFFTEQCFIVFGCFLLASGVNIFLLPCKLSTGGVTSIGTMLLYLCNIRISVTNIAANLLLFVIGHKFLGRKAVLKTIFGIVYLSFFLEITSSLPFFTDNLFLAAVSGGILTGLGIGLVVRVEASTGGSDFLSLIIKHFFPFFSISGIILAVDGLIIILTGIVFKSFEVMFYSLLSLYVSYKITDLLLSFGYNAKAIQIFSDKYEKIAECIIQDNKRGVSAFYCKGMYTQKNGCMLLCIINPKELPSLIRTIKRIDRSSFIAVSEVTEVLGNGF